MKSVVNMLRVLLLLLFCFVLVVYSFANTVNNDGDKSYALHQKTIVSFDLPGSLNHTNSTKFKAPTTIITLTGNDYQSRIAQLHWSTSAPGLAGTYTIQRFNLSTGWIDIATLPFTTTLEYNDIISFPYCSPTDFSYRIQFKADILSSDDATSAIVGPFALSDLTSPENTSNLIIGVGPPILLGWDRITNDSISRYDIQRTVDLNSWGPPVGSVSNTERVFWDVNVTNACENSFKYIVTTIDKCGNHSAPDYENKYIQTIKLDVPQPGPCDKSAKLVWNSYKNMPGGLSGYTVYRIDGITSSFKIIDVTDTSYVDNYNFQNGVTYLYSIGANDINGQYASNSCQRGWLYNSAILPDTVYISQVSVEDNNYISVGCYLTPANTVVTMYLERSDDNGSTFQTIDTIVSPVPQQYYFNDSTADVHAQSYYYRLVAIDDCGNTSLSINTSKSIWLQCAASETQNTLDWTGYESWLQGVEGYDVLRTLNQDPSSTKTLTAAAPGATSYSDLLTSFDASKMPCYWVEAKENPGNHYFQNAVSKSNTCCVLKDPILFMPNAFNPEGKNKLFRPVPEPIFVDTHSFKMTIFNRWGQQLFETTDIVKGWDGSVNGQFTPAGQYVYLITYKSPEGKEFTKRGSVILVR
jgi:gliding motility-associated-like protein